MVKVGFLSRVCPFIWREDLHNMIKDTHEWRENPFHSRLYPGSLSCNKHGMMVPVLMIDVERDNISSGLDIFREQFDRSTPLSPCGIPYLFFTVLQNQLTNTERKAIIDDINHHISSTQFVHVYGLSDIYTLVTLWQNVTIRLCMLLMGLCAPQTNHRLFIQVEKDPNPDAIILAFNSVDYETVMDNLPRLSSFIKQCVCNQDHLKIFTHDDFSIIIGSKTILIKKGSYQISSKPIPVDTQEHTSFALSKMVKQPEKRSFFSASSTSMCSTMTLSQPSIPSAHSTSPLVQPHLTTPSVSSLNQSTERCFHAIEQCLESSLTRMDNIETLCLHLKGNTDTITQQLQQLTANLSLACSPSSPCPSPSRKTTRLSNGNELLPQTHYAPMLRKNLSQ